MKITSIILVFLTVFFVKCMASDDVYFKLDPYASPTVGSIRPGIRILDLSGNIRVNDDFIEELSNNAVSKTIDRINLIGTNITAESFKSILRSPIWGTEIGTHEFKESGRYGGFSNDVYIETDLPDFDLDLARRPVPVTLWRSFPDGSKASTKGIKLLAFERRRK